MRWDQKQSTVTYKLADERSFLLRSSPWKIVLEDHVYQWWWHQKQQHYFSKEKCKWDFILSGTCIHGRFCFITFVNCPEFKAKRMLVCKIHVCLHNTVRFHKCRRVNVIRVRQWAQEHIHYCDPKGKVNLSEIQGVLVSGKGFCSSCFVLSGSKTLNQPSSVEGRVLNSWRDSLPFLSVVTSGTAGKKRNCFSITCKLPHKLVSRGTQRLNTLIQIFFQAWAVGLQLCVKQFIQHWLLDRLSSAMSAYIQNNLLRLLCSASCPGKHLPWPALLITR